jgi:hypothetical protein
MASFTDAISQFNPYVQQLPVEAMAQVGMYKQQQYDQGVQKIQSYMDRMAGLEVTDKHKPYLQSKLNELSGRLKTFAGADFSNQQLVSSVGGMATQVGNDPIIQSGVYSAQMIKKGLANLEKAKKDGKSAPENEWLYNNKLQSWMMNKDLKAKFTEDYDPYFDWQKHLKDTFNEIKPDGFTAEQVFETDPSGRIRYNPKTGKPIYSKTMTHIESEGIFPERVRATLEQIMSDPRVNNQLGITGKYTYRGIDGERLATAVEDQRRAAMTNLYLERDNLSIRKSAGYNVDAQLFNLDANITKTNEYFDELTQSSFSDPESVKGNLYSQQVKNNYTSMYGQLKSKTTNMDNPGWKADFELVKEANEQSRFAQRLSFDAQKQREDIAEKRKDRESREKIAMMRGSKKGVDTDGDGIADSFEEDDLGRLPTQGAQESNIDPIIQSENEYQSAADNFKNTSDDFLFSTILARNPKNQQMIDRFVSAGKSVEEAKSIMLDNAAKKAGMDPVEYRASLSKSAIREYNKLTPEQQVERKVLASNYNSYMASKNNFEYQAGLKKEDDRILSNLIDDEGRKALATGKIKPLKGTYQGRPIELSPQDQYDLAMYVNGHKTYFGFALDPAVRKAAQASEQRLKESGKGYLLDEALKQSTGAIRGFDVPTMLGRGLTGAYDTVAGKTRSLFTGDTGRAEVPLLGHTISKIVNDLDNDVLAKARSVKSELISKRHNIRPNLDMEVFTGDTKTNTALLSKLKSIVGNANTREANASADMDKLAEILLPAKNAADLEGGLTFKFKPKAGTTTPDVEIVLNDKGGRVGGVTITAEQAASLGVNIKGMYESEDTKRVRTLMQNRGGKTSSGDYSNADEVFYNDDVAFTKQNFPNLVGYTNKDVKANIVTSNDGLHYGVFYIKGSNGKITPKEVGPYQDLDQLVQMMKKATPQIIDLIP